MISSSERNHFKLSGTDRDLMIELSCAGFADSCQQFSRFVKRDHCLPSGSSLFLTRIWHFYFTYPIQPCDIFAEAACRHDALQPQSTFTAATPQVDKHPDLHTVFHLRIQHLTVSTIDRAPYYGQPYDSIHKQNKQKFKGGRSYLLPPIGVGGSR